MNYPTTKRDRAILEILAKATSPVLATYWSGDEADMKAIRKLINVGYADLVGHPTVMGVYLDGVRQPAEALQITDAGRYAIT